MSFAGVFISGWELLFIFAFALAICLGAAYLNVGLGDWRDRPKQPPANEEERGSDEEQP
jgi:hypothetical protein